MTDILLVQAHPDDESFVGGGTLSHYTLRGLRTALLTFTDGQLGRATLEGDALSPRRLGDVRRRELLRAVEILGIETCLPLGWLDGRLKEIPDHHGITTLTLHLRKLRPRVLITFGPEGGGNGHPDHQAACRWCNGAFDLAAETGYDDGLPPHAVEKLYWITWPAAVDALRGISGSPATTQVTLDREARARKRRAFLAHETQQHHLPLYDKFLHAFQGKEYFHLARSRVGRPDEIETCLLDSTGALVP